MRRVFLFCTAFFCVTLSAHATVFDFHNLGTLSSTKSLTVDNITINLQASSGILTSTATAFGVDGTGANDAFNLLDGGNGTAENLLFSFNKDVVIDSVTTSLFDGADAGAVDIKGVGNFPLASGTTAIGQTADATSSNRFLWSGPLTPSDTNGFSIDSITVHTVPEPASLALSLPAITLLLRRPFGPSKALRRISVGSGQR
jgi:hypothetical protein